MLLVVRPGAPSSVLVTSSDALVPFVAMSLGFSCAIAAAAPRVLAEPPMSNFINSIMEPVKGIEDTRVIGTGKVDKKMIENHETERDYNYNIILYICIYIYLYSTYN